MSGSKITTSSMAIKPTKIENNQDPDRKCDKCGKSIRIGETFYLEKNETPVIPQVDKLGFYICEVCHNKEF